MIAQPAQPELGLEVRDLAADALRDRLVESAATTCVRPPPSASRRRRSPACVRGSTSTAVKKNFSIIEPGDGNRPAPRTTTLAGSTAKPASSATSATARARRPSLATIARLEDAGDELRQQQRGRRLGQRCRGRIARDHQRRAQAGTEEHRHALRAARVHRDDHRVLPVGPRDRVAAVRRGDRAVRARLRMRSRRISRKPPPPTRSSESITNPTTSSGLVPGVTVRASARARAPPNQPRARPAPRRAASRSAAGPCHRAT